MRATDHFVPLLMTAAEREALFKWLTPAGICGPATPPVAAAPAATATTSARPATPAPTPRSHANRHV